MTSSVPTVRDDLRRSTADGVGYSFMVGLGETYFPAFLLASGAGEVSAGLVATLPMLAGALLQLASPWAVARLGSHRRWVVACAAVQTATFVPLVLAALSGGAPTWLVFAIASAYWAAGLATGPAWNTWISSLVPRSIRPRYFALRTRTCQAAVLASLLGGGALLDLGVRRSREMQAFAGLFLIAGLCRLASTRFLARHSEPRPMPSGFRAVSASEWLRRLRASDDGRLIAYMLAVQAAAQVAAPFFTPFMLRELRLPYGQYMCLVAAALAGRVLALPLLGLLAQRYGVRRLLVIGGVGIVPLALPWALTDSVPWLFLVQLATGACWAAYELATFLAFFEHIREEERTSVLTLFNLANASTFAAGSLLGGWLLRGLGIGASGYLALFFLSSALRASTLLLLRRVGQPGPVPARPGGAPFVVRPSAGASIEPS